MPIQMQVELDNISKLYGETWIFRNITHTFKQGSTTAVRGENGSGKSTLLSIVMGLTLPSEGKIGYFRDGQSSNTEDMSNQLSFAAPYAYVFEEFSAGELVDQIGKFRPWKEDWKSSDILHMAHLYDHRNKPVAKFSTGMKQRLRLILAMAMQGSILIFDEPTSNLDERGKAWFQHMLDEHLDHRTLIIASNQEEDLRICTDGLELKRPASL